jgi:two-component system OmpR family response regulator
LTWAHGNIHASTLRRQTLPDRPLKRILLVDDDPDIRALVSAALGGIAGYAVQSCSSAREALAVVCAFAPDLILLDFMMPESDGLSALKALRGLEGTVATPVVFMTASAQPHDLRQYDGLGCLGVIRKPFNPISLPQTLESFWQPSPPRGRSLPPSAFEDLRRTYLEELPAKIEALESAAETLAAAGWDKAQLEAMHHLTHRLAGSSGLYRMSELSRVATLLEQIVKRLLGSADWPPSSSPAEMTTLVKALRRTARAEARAAQPRPEGEVSPRSR